MTYIAKDFSNLLGTKGLSENLLKNHLTLYLGYVTNVNKLLEKISAIEKTGDPATPEATEMKRRLGWEWNGMRLHEYYFENIKNGGAELNKNSELFKKLTDNFGSYESWERSFRASGMMRGIGWIIAYYDLRSDKIFNVWINEHDTGHLSGAIPLLVMDVFEHAYMLDYGIKKADYIEIFFSAIDWDIAARRFDAVKR